MADEDGATGAGDETPAATTTTAPLATIADVMPGQVAAAEELPPTTLDAPQRVAVIDEQGRSYATGKRKDAVARVWIKPGNGQLTVNGREGMTYFARPTLQMLINQPFGEVNRTDQYDVWCTVRGGGLSGQAGAIRHGISKALTLNDPTLRAALKKGGYLTRDARVVERKKYGKPKARRSFQFSKR